MQARTAPRTDENIETVLTRFQSWNSSQPELAKDGVREITYEEAVQSSRYRRKSVLKTPPASLTDEKPNAGPPPKTPPPLMPRPLPKTQAIKSCEAKSTAATSCGKEVPLRAPGKINRKRKRADSHPTFHAALTTAIKPSRSNAMEDRQVSMSVRLAASEQALIKLRAAASGLSASAYLRQCALDVEILRSQLQQFVTAAARSRLAELSVTEAASFSSVKNEGWLERWKRIWNRAGGQLSLKA
jgi:hypothetical protein